MTKKVLVIIVTFLVLIFFIVSMFFLFPKIVRLKIDNKPNNQLNTTWLSQNKDVVLFIDKNHNASGYIIIDNQIIDIFWAMDIGLGTGIHIYPIDVLKEEYINEKDKCEYWICTFISKDKFEIVVKESTYFQEGQKITFYKVTQQ